MTLSVRTVCAAAFLCGTLQAWGGILPAEFAERRGRLLAIADTDAAVVFRAADVRVRSGDVSYRYRQESNFLYLTGLSEPSLTLLVVPRGVPVDGKTWNILLFAPLARAGEIRGSGEFLNAVILDANRFDEIFARVAGSSRTVFISSPDLAFVNDWINNRSIFLDQEARQRFREKFPGIRIRNAGPLVTGLRERKSPAEIDLIRSAIRMTEDGLRRAIAICSPGRKEYELQAEVEYEMTRQGAGYTAYPSIIGSGPNSVILHYDENRREMHAGEVVVMDVGAEYEGYAADITRTVPVSGAFTDAEKKVYTTVLKAQDEAIKMIRPGIAWSAPEKRAREVLAAAGFARYMPHGLSHHVGIDVHDAGSFDTLRAGMVITVEPGIYVPPGDTLQPPEFRGFGVRIEDDILVTENGAEVLSSGIPKDMESLGKMAGKRKN